MGRRKGWVCDWFSSVFLWCAGATSQQKTKDSKARIRMDVMDDGWWWWNDEWTDHDHDGGRRRRLEYPVSYSFSTLSSTSTSHQQHHHSTWTHYYFYPPSFSSPSAPLFPAMDFRSTNTNTSEIHYRYVVIVHWRLPMISIEWIHQSNDSGDIYIINSHNNIRDTLQQGFIHHHHHRRRRMSAAVHQYQ